MGASKKKRLTVNADASYTLNSAHQAVLECKWKVKKMESFCIKASAGTSMSSWGETITIQVQPVGNVSNLEIKSEAKWQLIDWGKNNENINKFIRNLSKYVVIL